MDFPYLTPTFLCIFFLFAGWVVLIRFYSKSRQRESLAVKRFEEVRRQMQEQKAGIDALVGLFVRIYEFGFEKPNAESRPALLKMILDFSCQITKCSVGSFMLMDQQTNDLVIAAAKGISEPSVLSTRLKVGEGIAGRVAETGKSILVDDIDSDIRFLKKKNVEYRSKSLLSVPVKIKNRIIGVINLHAEEPHHSFEEREVRLLTVLTHQVALMIESLELYGNLQGFYTQIVEVLARALKLKEQPGNGEDRFEYAQLRNYARKIAQELSLPESITMHIEFACLMHGIGKIGIEDAILKKPGNLTSEEYERIKKHPEIGEKMISQVQFLSPVSSMILYHQERWDGKGYPAGLAGEEIPLGARIVAVVHAYHAMVSDKPYRKALNLSEAVQELKRGAGTQFDPKVVEVFIKVIHKEQAGESGIGAL